MEYKNMSEEDLKMSLLSGKGIKVDNLIVDPYKLKEIRDFGYSKYEEIIKLSSLSVNDFIESTNDDDKRKILEEEAKSLKPFDFYFRIGGIDIREILLGFLSLIFRTDDIRTIDENNGIIAIGLKELGIIKEDKDGFEYLNSELLESIDENNIRLIHRDNFDDIVNIVKLQNHLDSIDNVKRQESNPIDKKTKALMEHMDRMRRKVEEKKRQQRSSDEEEIGLTDVISAVSSKSNSIDIFNIWDLTLYQIYDAYARLELIDSYDKTIKAMLAGSEKAELRHWSSKI